MQYTLISVLTLATAALALPQQWNGNNNHPQNFGPGPTRFGNGPRLGNNGPQFGQPGFHNPNDGGQQKGYRTLCTCKVNGEEQPDIGQDACNDLHSRWSNLQWDGQSCRDQKGVGLEENGWASACQRVAGTSDKETPGNVEGSCSPF